MTESYIVKIFAEPLKMMMECTVTKAYGQYEMTNVIEYDRIMISIAFKEYNENIKVSGDIYIDGPDFPDFKKGRQIVFYSILGYKKNSRGRKSPVWQIDSFETCDK